MKILLELAYIGTDFAGFQVQPDKRTVQSTVQDAIEAVYGVRYPLKGCSRTDSGVHALQYFAVFETGDDAPQRIPPERIPLALNVSLPPDISVKSARTVPDSFHVRHDVEWKEYEYLILNSRIRDPFLNGRAYWLSRVLTPDMLAVMKSAAAGIVGTHDFSGFMSVGSKVTDTVRTVKRLDILTDGDLIRIRIAADGFLYNMVRIIVGTLIDCAHGRKSGIPEIIASRDRSEAGFTAPAEGLYLRQVRFRDL